MDHQHKTTFIKLPNLIYIRQLEFFFSKALNSLIKMVSCLHELVSNVPTKMADGPCIDFVVVGEVLLL